MLWLPRDLPCRIACLTQDIRLSLTCQLLSTKSVWLLQLCWCDVHHWWVCVICAASFTPCSGSLLSYAIWRFSNGENAFEANYFLQHATFEKVNWGKDPDLILPKKSQVHVSKQLKLTTAVSGCCLIPASSDDFRVKQRHTVPILITPFRRISYCGNTQDQKHAEDAAAGLEYKAKQHL